MTLSAKVGGTPITKFSRDGVFCRADGTAELGDGCAPTLKVALDHKRDLDVYYWAPGVIDPTKIEITAEVTAAAYPKDAKDAVTVTATKNVAFFKRVKLTNAAIRNLNVLAPIVFGLGWADLADYCATAAKTLVEMSDANVPAGLRTAAREDRPSSCPSSQRARAACSSRRPSSPRPSPSSAGSSTGISSTAWASRRRGSSATRGSINFFAQMLLEYSGFYDAFLNSLKGFLYADFNPADPDANALHHNDRMEFTIYEVSYRGPSSRLGNVHDALYVRMEGTRGAAEDGSGGAPIAPYTEYVQFGYWPGCWLDPKLNHEEFWLPIGFNPCNIGDV